MSEFNQSSVYSAEQGDLRSYILSVYTKMGIALAITALVAWFGYNSLATGGIMASVLTGSPWIALLFVAAQFIICIALSAGLTRLSSTACAVLLYVYAAITGVTFSVLPYAYDVGTFFGPFGFAALMFGCCVVIGHTTNTDLSRFTSLLFGGLIAMVIATIASLFIPALRSSLILSYIGVVLFLGLTAYDMQKIKSFYFQTDGTIRENLGVYGAFQLYLDFINIFLYVLRILGNRSNNK